jgi:uncharacterized protein YjbI with pentapeptide repeats
MPPVQALLSRNSVFLSTSTHLEDTNLEGANLTEADLEGATGVTVEELEEQAASLEAATMPDGTEHD